MKKEFKIGLAAIASLIILFFGINYLKGINLFKSESYYHVDYTEVNGLALSSPVYANGSKSAWLGIYSITTISRGILP